MIFDPFWYSTRFNLVLIATSFNFMLVSSNLPTKTQNIHFKGSNLQMLSTLHKRAKRDTNPFEVPNNQKRNSLQFITNFVCHFFLQTKSNFSLKFNTQKCFSIYFGKKNEKKKMSFELKSFWEFIKNLHSLFV